MKTAFLFSGQGAQAIGMGKELCENFPAADEIFNSASEALGFDIKEMIWNGDKETLMITEIHSLQFLQCLLRLLRLCAVSELRRTW